MSSSKIEKVEPLRQQGEELKEKLEIVKDQLETVRMNRSVDSDEQSPKEHPDYLDEKINPA